MKAHDEVCGMEIEAESAAAQIRLQGKTYFFCSDRCRGMFAEHPDRYVAVTAEGETPGDHQHHH